MAGPNLLSSSSPIDRTRRERLDQTHRALGQLTTDILEERKRKRAAAAAAALDQADRSTISRDEAARNQQIATDKLGNPDLRLTNPETIKTIQAQSDAADRQQFLGDHPRTASWASNYNNAQAGGDDLETIGFFESMGNAIAKRSDAIYDNVQRDGRLDMLLEMRRSIEQADMSLDDFIKQRQEQADPETPEMLSPEAKALWDWVSSRLTFTSEETRKSAKDAIDKEMSDILAASAAEQSEREMLWPAATWRREIERKMSELSGQPLEESVVGLFKVAKDNPLRFANYMLEIGVESGLTIGAGVTAGALTRNPALAASVMGVGSMITSEGLYFDELVQQYGYDLATPEGRTAFLKDPQVIVDMRDKAKAYGMVVGLLDGVSAGAASKTLVDNPVGEFFLQMFVQSSLGGGGEALGRLAAGEKIDWVEVLLEAMAEAVTAPLEIGGMAISGGRRKIERAVEAKQRKELFNVLAGKVEGSKLKERDAARLATAIQEVTENGPAENIYVDPNQIEELFQGDNVKGTIEDFFAAVPELDFQKFTEARDNGELYVIPTGVYAARIAGTEMDTTLSEHIRIHPDDMSAAEVKTFQEDLKQAQKDLSKNADTVQTLIGELEGPLADEFSRLRSEIIEAQGLLPDAAEKAASVLVASARAGAARAGVTVAEYLNRYSLPAVRNAQDIGPAPARPTISAPSLVSMLRSTDGAADAIPDVALVRAHLEENGFDPTDAPLEDVRQAWAALEAQGVLSHQLDDQADAARPGTLDEPIAGEEMQQTATLRGGEEDASAWGIDTSRRNKTRDIALRLQARQRKLYGKIAKKNRGPKTIEKMAQWMADEIEFELQTPHASAKGWYSVKFQKALDTIGQLVPELLDEKAATASKIPGVKTVADARAVMTALFAVSSNGTKVSQNVDNAVAIMMGLAAGGTMDTVRHHRGIALNQNIETLLALAAEMGGEAMQTHLTQVTTMSAVNKELRAEGLSTKSGYPADMVVPYAAKYLGPKLSAFYANLAGEDGYLTMDLWWSRTINRYRGDVLPKVNGLKNAVDSKGRPIGLHRFKHLISRPDLTDRQALNYATEYAEAYARKGWKNGTEAERAANTIHKAANLMLDEAPSGAADRAFMIKVAQAAREELTRRTGERYSIADIQALLWYYEKRLYADMGVRDSGDISYEEAAAETVDKHRRLHNRPPASMQLNQGAVPGQAEYEWEGFFLPRYLVLELAEIGRDYYRELTGADYVTGQGMKALQESMVPFALSDQAMGERVSAALVDDRNGVPPNAEGLALADVVYDPGNVDKGMDFALVNWALSIVDSENLLAKVSRPSDALPDLERASPGRVPGVREVATKYMRAAGLPVRHPGRYAKVDVARATEIAKLYDQMAHTPDDPETKAAYEALAKETLAQYEALKELGLTFEWITGEDPYATPADAIRDMQENKHLFVFPTDEGFGTLNEAAADHPLLAETGVMIDGRNAKVNDLFRIVHDVFGHGLEGASFGPRGEENAWQAHVRMFSPLAARAMTSETRGQNSWVNFGPYGEQNRANPKETIFADQKMGLLPEWVSTVGQVEDAARDAFIEDFNTKTLRKATDEERLKAFKRPGWYIVTAARSELGDNTSPENVARNQALLDRLRNEMGREVIELDGYYGGKPDGASFLVIGPASEGVALGQEYGQESVLSKDGLTYTDGSGRADVPFNGVTWGWDAKRSDFYSKFTKGIGSDIFSLHLQFPKPKDVTVDDGDHTSHYGATVENGRMLLTHWSPLPRETLDAGEAGTGKLPGPERERGGPKKVFFGLHIGQPGGYVREHSALGSFRHEVYVDPRKMYPWWRDPDGLREGMPKGLPKPQQLAWYETRIKQAGYLGYFVLGGNLGDTAALFYDVTPTAVVNDNLAKFIRTPAFDAWFGSSRVRNRDGSPRLVFRGEHGVAPDGSIGFHTKLGSITYSGELSAQGYAVEPNDWRDQPEAARVVPAYLKIENPIVNDDEDPYLELGPLAENPAFGEALAGYFARKHGSHIEDTSNWVDEINGDGLYHDVGDFLDKNPGGVKSLYALAFVFLDDPEFVKHAAAAGYDGAIYGGFGEFHETEFRVFSPEQIKSPWNKGTFDPNTADIMEQPNRGSIILPKELTAQAQISIFETADLSTVLHESGHFFLWQLQKQANDGLAFAEDQMAAVHTWWGKNADAIAKEAGVDAAQVTEYLTLGTTGQGDLDHRIHVALHEQFARGFEAYAMEGKSPSNALRAVFESFAAWLLSIYKSAKKLNVSIDDDIRRVFDRMLAADEELVSAAEQQEINDEIARTAKEMGLDEESYQRLVKLSEEARDEGRQIARAEMLASEVRARKQEYQARLAQIDAEEREKVNSRPGNRAFQWLAYGRWLGEETPGELPLELRLDTDMLNEEYGTEVTNSLPRGRRPVFKKDTGLSADEVAGWFGIESGAKLLEELKKAPSANQEIKSAVQARAQQELGDIMGKPEEIAQVVTDAFHGEKRGQVIVAELRAINRLGGRGKKMTSRAQARQIAVDVISRMPIREAIQSSRFQEAERRHAEHAARALAQGDIEGAFDAKRKQLIQHAMYSESRKANGMLGKVERLAGRLRKKGTRENLAPEYLGAIDDILENYDFRKISGKAEARRARLLAYVEAMKAAGREDELAIPAHVLHTAQRIPYKRLSVQRLKGVYDSLKNIEHMARRRQKLHLAKQERDLQAVRDEIAQAFSENIVPGKPNRVESKGEKRMSGIKGYFNLVRNADTVLRAIDGWKNRGVMARYFKDAIDEAGITAHRMRLEATEKMDALFSVYSTGDRRRMATRKMWKGYDQALSKWDIISIALNMGNQDNLERLTSRDSRGSLTRQQVDNLVDNLDKRDWDFVQSVWDYLSDTYWPLIAAREERVTGVAPEKVAAQELQTKYGAYRGGYYPIVYDRRYSAKVSEDQNRDLMLSMMAGRFGKAQTKNGHTKERAAGGGGRTVQLGMHVLFGHVNSVIHDLAYGEAVNTTWKLLQDADVKSQFERYGRLEDHQALELWVQDVAAGPAAGTHVLAGTMRRLKSGFTLSKLAFNMSTVAVQVTGLSQSVVVIGADNMVKGLATYLFSRRGRYGLAQDIKERSPFMAERETTFQRDVYDLANDTQLDPLGGPTSTALHLIMNAGFWAMQKVQYYAVDVPTWLGAHHQGLAQGMTDEEAAVHADRMVARAQASGLYADRTAIERGTMGRNSRQNEFIRLFTALGSYMFAKFNVTNEVLGRAARDIRSPEASTVKAVLKATVDLVLLYSIEAILYNAIKGTLPGQGDDDDEAWTEFLAAQTALSLASVFPFIRDISSAVQGYSGGGAYSGISETIGRAIGSAGDVVMGDADLRDLRAASDLTGLMIPGYPSTAVWRLIDGIGATGEEPSPLAVIMGR